MLRPILLLVSLLFILCALPEGAWGGEMVFDLTTAQGRQVKVRALDSINARGQREMRFETANMAKVLLGHGRDINGDGTIEAFFVLGDNGISFYERNTPRETSWERARAVLAQHARYSGGAYLNGITEGILSFLFFGMEHLLEAQETFNRDWMDLEELRIVLEQNKATLTRDQYIYGLNLLLEGNRVAYERLEKSLAGEHALMWGADAGLWLSGAVLLKWAGRALKALGARVGGSLDNAGARTGTGAGLRLGLKTYQRSIHEAIRAVTFNSALKRSKNLLIAGARNVRAEWKYIAASTTAQLTAESISHYNSIKDPNPTTAALNLLHHPEIHENVSIALVATMLMTGANSMANSKLARFALIGVVGASSSYAVGTAIDGAQSRDRVMFDTAWSLGIDSAQLMLEFHVLHKFTEAAVRSRRPHLKVAGYAIVFVSQLTGYYAYSRAAQWVDPRTELRDAELQLVPILAAH